LNHYAKVTKIRWTHASTDNFTGNHKSACLRVIVCLHFPPQQRTLHDVFVNILAVVCYLSFVTWPVMWALLVSAQFFLFFVCLLSRDQLRESRYPSQWLARRVTDHSPCRHPLSLSPRDYFWGLLGPVCLSVRRNVVSSIAKVLWYYGS
jgi:hypothetical protein